MARKETFVDEENQKFSSKYLSDAVNSMVNNVTKATKLPPGSFKHLAEDDSEKEYISLGIPELDKGLNGGLPKQTIVEIYGPPGGGKSFLACYKSAASVTKNFGNVFLYDIENAFNRDRAEALGVATNRMIINNIYETGEQVLSAICSQLYDEHYYKKTGKPQPRWADLIIIDSIAALGSRNEMEADYIQDIDGIDEKSGPKQMPASRARMISSFQGRLIKSLNNSAGLWMETMPGTFLPDNSFYSFMPSDQDISDALIEDINNVVKTRQSIVSDPKHPNLWKVVWMTQNRRDKLDKYIVELSVITGEDEAFKLKDLIENTNEKDYINLKNQIDEKFNCNKIMMKIDKIMDELLSGKNMLPPTPKSVSDFEVMTRGYIYDTLNNKGLPVAHYNPGPTIIIINQVRIGNIGSFTGTTIERPGGYAFKHGAGTVLYVTPITNRSKGEVKSSDGQSVAGWKSNVVVEKSRFTIPKKSFEMIIPFISDDIDAFSAFMSDCQKNELWDIVRKFYCLPRDGSLIKTKDENEWKEFLLQEGLSYLQRQMNYSDNDMIPIYEALDEQVSNNAFEENVDDIGGDEY